jgi:uncharacterized protein YjeT (DUF2065 family)
MNPEDLLGYDIDILLAMRQEWKRQAAHFQELAGRAEQEVLRRMGEQGATVYKSERAEAQAAPGGYDYLMETLSGLIPLLQPGEWADVVQEVVTHKVNKVKLNQLARRGGDFSHIIFEATKPQAMRLTKVVLKEESKP